MKMIDPVDMAYDFGPRHARAMHGTAQMAYPEEDGHHERCCNGQPFQPVWHNGPIHRSDAFDPAQPAEKIA